MGAKELLRRLPIRAKLTLAYTGVIALMLSGIGVFLFVNFRSGLDASLNTALRRAPTTSPPPSGKKGSPA